MLLTSLLRGWLLPWEACITGASTDVTLGTCSKEASSALFSSTGRACQNPGPYTSMPARLLLYLSSLGT